jgi:hypothetical protein
MDKETLVKDHLQLAALYHNGKGVWWKTMEEASRVLSLTEPHVTVEQISQARKVAAYPAEVLRLFEKTGTNTYTRRKLLEAKGSLGWPEIVKRALALKPAETKTERLALLSILSGEERKVTAIRGVTPLALQKVYEEGLESGRWKNIKQASKEIGCNSKTLYRAMAICELPKTVTDYFPLNKISVYLGEDLINVLGFLGDAEFGKRVRSVEKDYPNLPYKSKLAKVKASKDSIVSTVKARRARGKLVIELHCEDKNGRLTERQQELVSVISKTISAFNEIR